MSSGHKREVVTLRERVRSTDQNRLQAFLAGDRAEFFRFLFNLVGDPTDRPFELGGALLVGDKPPDIDPSAIATPLRGDVFDGLVVTPIVGLTSVHISPGIVGVHDPDGQTGSSQGDPPSADDSSYKIVVEPTGVQTNGVLTIAANAGPGVRIDVIECRRTELVLETDVRDVFDPSTGTSSSQTVDKVGAARLEFRVRAGVAGSGFPANVQGWLPLAVAHIPSGGGATTDDVDFWDVRPLVKDRVRQPHRSRYGYGPDHEMQQLYGDVITAGGENRISGHFVGQINGVVAGGEITRGSPGADQAYIDVLDAEWQEDGFTVPLGGLVYLWLMFPYNLPRWVRYNRTPVGGLRFPQGMRGIPILSAKAPAGQAHSPPAAPFLNVPDYLDAGLGATTVDAVCAVAFTAALLDTPAGFVAGGEWVEFLEGEGPPIITPPFNGTGNAFDVYQLVAGTDFPRDARKVRVLFTTTFTGVVGTNLNVKMQAGADQAGTNPVSHSFVAGGERQFDAGGTMTLYHSADIERLPEQTGLGADLFVRMTWGAGGFTTKVNEEARVIGWKQT